MLRKEFYVILVSGYSFVLCPREMTCICFSDEIWCKLFGSIERFVSVYTQEWPDCLDICLLPLRNTVSQMTEFTPAFLLMGRYFFFL